MLTGLLDWYREGVHKKLEGLSPEHASAVPFRSATSIAGVVKHLAAVEDVWFTARFAGRPWPEPWGSVDWEADPDWEFHSATSDTLEALVALYDAACARSRSVAAEHDLDETVDDTRRGPFSLRFVLVHMIEETARHLGHLDILREHLDGATGA